MAPLKPRSSILLALLPLLLGWPMPVFARDPGVIRIYPSHGSPDQVVIQGRFLENEDIRPPKRGDSRWRNARRALKELESDEIKNALLEIEVGGQRFQTRTDNDGVFRVDAIQVGGTWPVGPLRVTARALEDQGHPTPAAQGAVYILPAGPSVAVISDFDDTVVVSNITSKRGMIKTALFENASQLAIVPGGPQAYRRAVAAGAAALFYVSGSPQNFVNRIVEFLALHGYPAGPLELKNLGTDPTFDAVVYKLGRIQAILAAHPQTRFLLVGDSGEKDPEIYLEIRRQFPDRILGIVIRQVPGGENRPERFTGMTTAPDYTADPDILARLLRPAAP